MVANNSTTSESSRIQEDNISDDEWYQSLFEDDAQEDGAGVGVSDAPKDKNVETLKMVVSKLLTRISRLEAKRADPTPTQNTESEESTPPIDDIKFDELKASATVSLAFNKCGASGYLSPLSVIYSKVSIPSSTYNATWASTVPQLREYYLTRKGGDPLAPIRTAKNAEDFTAALQKVTMDLEQVHDLTPPVIVCLLLCEMDHTQDTLVKIKANDIATCCLTAPDVKSIEETLRNIADSDSDVMIPDLPYDTDFDSLPGNSLICPHKHALWTRILYTVTKVWTRMYLGYVTPDDVKWKWTSIRQKKDEWISQFLARERQAWQGLSSCLSFRKMQLPSGYDRAVQLLSAVNSDLRKGYNDYIRTERLDVDTLRYEDVANQLVIIETTQSMKFPWDQPADQANKAQSKKGNTKHESGGGKWSGGGTGGKWAGGGNGGKWSGGNGGKWSNGGKWNGGAKSDKDKGSSKNDSKPTKKADKWCTYCNKYVTHTEEQCWKNPACTTTPTWFKEKMKNPKSADADSKKEGQQAPMFMADDHQQDILAVPAIRSRVHPHGEGAPTDIVVGVDTLCECNLIDSTLVKSCELVEGDTIPKLAGFRGNEFQPTEKVIVHLSIGDRQMRVKALAIDMASLCIDMAMVLGAESMRNMHATISMGDATFKIGMLDVSVPIVQMRRKENSGMPFLSCGLSARSSEEVEQIKAMTDAELEKKASDYLQSINYKSPKMEFAVPQEHSDGLYQCDAPFNIPSGLVPGVKHKIDKEVKAGHWKEVPRSNALWISPAFAKGKGRQIQEGEYCGYEEARILIDLRRLNSLVEVPEHYHLGNANVETFMRTVNNDSCWFSCIDIDSAFESLEVTEEGSNLLCFNIMGKVYKSTVALQGFSYSAMCWTYHLRHGLQAALGANFTDMCAIFVDDILVFGKTYDQCMARRRVICAVLRALKKKISTKTPATVTTHIDCVGLEWSSDGVKLNKENEATLRTALTTTPKSGAQLRRLLGSVNFAQGAFPYLEKRSDLSSAKKTLFALVDVKPFRLTQEGRQALAVLANAYGNAPLALHSYGNLISGVNTCWTLIFDASEDAVGGALYRCKGSTSDIDTEDLKDPAKSSLVGVFSKALDVHQRGWAVYEKEIYSVLTGMRKWYRLLVATTKPTTKGDPMAVPKILILTDSMVCMYRWRDFKLPESPLSSVKSRRFLGWCETVASWQALPYVIKHCKGMSNDFADLLSRWVSRPSAPTRPSANDEESTMGAPPYKKPCMMNTISHGANEEDDIKIDKALELTDEQAKLVAEALIQDDSTFQGVRIKDIYKVAIDKNDDLPPATAQKIRRWLDDKYFLTTDEEVPLLMTTSIIRDADGDTEQVDSKKDYLMVIPADCKLDLTNVPDPYDNPDLRRSIMLIAHDSLLGAHGNTESMAAKIMEFCWWPRLMSDCREHRVRCPSCRPTTYKMAVGRLPSTRRRFLWYAIDHKELNDKIKERLNLPQESAIVSAVDMGTGEALFQYVPSHSSRHVVIFLWTRIISVHGPISHLHSDQGGSLISETMVGLSKLLGYEMKTTSSRNPKANGRVERAHRSLGLILDTMLHTGDGKDADDLRVYLAAAESRANLKINSKDQVSVHGAVYGQQPNSLMTKAIVEDIQDVEIQAEDVQQIARVARYATDALADERDVKAHYNAGVRIAQVHQGRIPDISEGDKILHQGVEDVVEKIYIADNSGKPTVVILGSGLKVPVSELQPLPDDRPVHLPTNAIDDDKVTVDDYALVKASDDRVAVVRIINIKPGKEVEGHIYDAGEKGAVFLPLWSVDGVFKRGKSKPPRSPPALLTTPYDKILFKVELNLTGRMKPASRDRMHAVHVQYAAQ